jgi:hypothetical protein
MRKRKKKEELMTRLDDTELRHVDNNAKPNRKPLTALQMKKHKVKIFADIARILKEDK